MKRSHGSFFLSVAMSLMFVCGLLENVQAKEIDSGDSDSVYISGGGGIFYPFQGTSGFNAVIQAAGKISPTERLGVELEFRKYETEFFNAKNIDTRSYILRGIGQYFFRPKGYLPMLAWA